MAVKSWSPPAASMITTATANMTRGSALYSGLRAAAGTSFATSAAIAIGRTPAAAATEGAAGAGKSGWESRLRVRPRNVIAEL